MKEAYKVPCRYCRARIGKPCFQLSHWRRTGKYKWSQPHSIRVKEAEARRDMYQPDEPKDT